MTAVREPQRVLEICAETLQGCEAACAGGADRVELCSALIEGGLTPSHGFIEQAVATTCVPVHVLLRPRGGDFVYSDAEFAMICSDLRHSAALGAAGVVAGILLPDGSIDLDRIRHLVDLAGPLEVTFHRAFDQARHLPQALEDVIATGCHRLLTSGGQPSALHGAPTLGALASQARSRIRIAAGGGVNLQTAPHILEQAEAVDLHASLRSAIQRAESHTQLDPLWNRCGMIDVEDVRAMARLLHPMQTSH
jgi:copper homeostasis protein